MRVGILCNDVNCGPELGAAAVAAEQAGFSSFMFGDHVVLFEEYPKSEYPYVTTGGRKTPRFQPDTHYFDPVVGMTWVAAATSRIEVFAGVMILPQRNPVVLAKELSTLDYLSKGRVMLGVGVGWAQEEYEAVGANWKTRGKRIDEYIDAMRALWKQPSSTFHGETVKFENAHCYPKPVRNSDIPIIVGGESEVAMKRIARAGDGWYSISLDPEEAASKIAHLHALTKERGRDPASLRIIKAIKTGTTLDDIKRFRDAGVTEFLLMVFGELPQDRDGLSTGIGKFGKRFVEPIEKL